MKRFKMLMMMIAFLGTGLGFGQVDIIPIRTSVAGFPTWTDTDVAGTTYLQLLIADSSTITPAMDFNVFTGETLSFKARTYGVAAAAEIILTVSISVDNGVSWTVLGTRTPANSTLNIQTPFDLSSYSGTQVKLKFSVGGTSNTVGVGINDIAIKGFVVCTPEPEINLQGNSNNIVSGATTTAIPNNTNFGSAEVGVGSIAKNFAIQNTGTEQLDLTAASPYITISGANASDFVLTSPPNTPIAAGANSTFEITFSPTSLGSRNATVTIANNDLDEDPYTFAIGGTGTYSNQSQILDVTFPYSTTGPEFNSNVEYINFIDATSTTSGKFIPMKLRITDGPDSDALPTVLTDLRISVIDLAAANQLGIIKTAILTTSGGTLISTATKVGSELVFSGMSGGNVTAADEGQQNIHLRVSIEENQIIDQTKLIFQVTSATSSAGGSSFALFNAGGAQTDTGSNARNRLNVTATKLIFNAQPQTTSVNGTMAVVIVEATDFYNRRDINYATAASITSTGTMSGAPLSASFNLGLASFPSVVHTVDGVGFTLTASAVGLTSVVSNLFNITTIVYVNGDFRPLFPTDLSANGTWEYYNGAVWISTAQGSWDGRAPQNTTATISKIFIDKIVGGAGSATKNYNCDFIIQAGGELNLVANDPPPVAAKMIAAGKKIEVLSGGILNVEGDIDVASTSNLIVRNGGTMILNQASITNDHPMWNGVELFEEGSFVIINDWDWSAPSGKASLLNLPVSISSNPNGYKFGNLLFDALPTSSFAIIGGGVGIVNLCENDLHISNSSVLYVHGATNKTGVNGFVVNGNMTIYDGKFSFGTSFSNDVFDHKFIINGDFVCSSNDDLKIHHKGIGNPTSLNGSVTFGGDVKINSSVSSFGNDGGTSSTTRMFVNFEGGTLASPKIIDIAPTAVAIPMNIKANSHRKLASQDLTINSVPSYTAAFIVESNSSLDFGWAADALTPLKIKRTTSAPAGTNNFFSSASSTLKITSPDGISATAGTLGNVQTSTAPTYNSVATFWYQGKQNQETGSGLPTSSSAKIVYVDLLNNSLTLTPTASVGISNTTTLDALGGRLEILKGTVIGSNTADFFGSGRLKMSDGVYKIASYYTVNPETNYLPRLENYGNYNLSGGTIQLVANNSTQIISGTPTYYNLKFSGSNTLSSNYIGISNSTAVATSIVISEDAIVDVKINSFGMLPLAPTFTMTDNSRFITAGTGVKPDPTGTYSLGPNTTIEFTNNSALTLQRPRRTSPVPTYANIIVSGSNVGNDSAGGGPNSNLSFQPSGSFRVTSTGTYKLFNSYGFSGSLSTAIKSLNSPAITLEDDSTIEYAGDNQTITHFNQNTNPSTLNYTNLTISGTGQKTLGDPTATFVNEKLNLNTSNFLINENEVVTVRESVNSTLGTLQIENNGQLIQINDAAINTGTGLNYKRTAQAQNFDYIYWSSPVDNFATLNLPGNNHYQWNTLFANSNGTQGNWETPSATMTVGRGYIARASNGATTPQAITRVFSGKPNNGTVQINVYRGDFDGVPYDAEPSNPNNLLTTKDDDNWNLVGNPYPSAIDAEKFLVENQSVLEGAVHIWTHATLPNSTVDPYYSDFTYNYNPADYVIYNKLGSSLPNTFNGKIAAAQGFMVNMLHAAPSGTSIVFNNAMRYSASFAPYDNSNFYRTQNEIFTEEKSRIWLDLVNTTTAEVGTILVGYAEEATIGKDHFYDCSFESRGDHSLYSLINAESFVIQGRALPFNIDDIVPLGFSVNRLGDLAISIRNVDGIFASDTPIFLEDKQLNIFHDLKDSPYFFNSEIGTFNDRFQLRYGTTLSAGDFGLAQSAIQIIGRDGIVYLKSKENLIDEVLIYDVLGRLLSKSTAANTLYLEIPLNILAKQAIIVKAKLANGTVVSKKIIF